jgi:proline racemase
MQGKVLGQSRHQAVDPGIAGRGWIVGYDKSCL